MRTLQEGMLILNDRFRVGQLLPGAGQSFGYQGTDLKADPNRPRERNVYIKQMHDLIPGSDETKRMAGLYKSIKERLKAKGNYLCLPLACGEAGGAVVTVFPWLEGTTLKKRFEAGLTQEEAVRISIALTKTIRELHKNGIAHLDLKPENVTIIEDERDGQIYIRLIDLDSASIDGVSLRDSVIGSLFYFSPEHAFPERFGEVSTASDMFSLAILLFELLMRTHPFDHADDYAGTIAAEDFRVPDNPYHRDVVQKICQCLCVDPRDRPTAGSLLWTLNSNYQTRLEAPDEESRWQEGRCFVQIAGVGENATFLRNYFESIDIDRNQLRGSRLEIPPGVLFRLRISRNTTSIIPLQEGIDIRVQGRKLYPEKPTRLPSAGTLKVGSNPELLFRVTNF